MSLSSTVLAERWGDIFGGINESNTFAGTTIASRADNIYDEFTTLALQREVVDDLYERAIAVRSDVSAWTDYLFDIAETALQMQCRDDTVRPPTDDLNGWFLKLNADFAANGDCFRLPTCTSTITVPTGYTNTGDGYLISSTVEPVDGKATYYGMSEVIRVICVSDSYSGETSAGAEEFTIEGETSVDSRAYNWPKGSGASSTLTAVIPSTAGILTDGDLDLWGTSNNTPTEWSLLSGTTAGTHIYREGTTIYRSSGYAAKFTGDGATSNTGIYQVLDQDLVESNTNYAITFWYRSDSASFTNGTLRIGFTNGSGTVINDNLGTAQSTTVTNTEFGSANGTWTRKSLVLRTPRNLPTELRLEFKFTSVVDNGESIFIDDINMSPMTQLYDGGPYHAMHGGNTPFAKDDRFLDTIANSLSTTSFVRCLDRAFALAENGIRLRVTASANISDALIT